MYKNQQELTDKALFKYYMVSSSRDSDVYSPFPFYLDKSVFDEMVEATIALDALVNRIICSILNGSPCFPFQSDAFDLKDNIIGLAMELPMFFWTRYDAFQRSEGGIFFSEFNYDKPCAQREIAIADFIQPHNNPNCDFVKKFREGLKTAWENFCKNNYSAEKSTHDESKISDIEKSDVEISDTSKSYDKSVPLVAILVDPGHYEELHLAHLFIDFLSPLGYDINIVGGQNLYIENDMVMAFGKKIDIILRQFPTEFLGELDCFDEILRLYDSGRVLLLNDPRSIIGQAKSLFATLWEMVDCDSDFLSEKEKAIIRRTVPHTRLFNSENKFDMEELKLNKDKYVVKAAFGRFSEEVYIGNMHSEEEWLDTISYVQSSEKLHIIQEFCQIKRERVLKFNGIFYDEVDAFGNFGIYLVNREFAGISLRFSNDYLSVDDVVWISAVGIREKSLQTYKYTESKKYSSKMSVGVDSAANDMKYDRNATWNTINDAAAFKHGYTGGYTGAQESFSLQALILDADRYSELEDATQSLVGIFKKTRDFVIENRETLCPVLGISDTLMDLVSQKYTDLLTFVGRFDWVIDTKGDLKLLEFNSETPAGLMESLVLSQSIMDNMHIHDVCIMKELESEISKKPQNNTINPNENMRQQTRECFADILNDYRKHKQIESIGFVCCAFGEDWYNTTILYDQIQDMVEKCLLGEVSGLQADMSKLCLYGDKLDAIYRYYPLDWFDSDNYYEGVIAALDGDTLSINPPSTFITQSKAFLALIYELLNNGFYTKEESSIISKYIPKTTLSPKKSFNGIYCAKPCFGREGEEVAFSFKQPFYSKEKQDYIFQEWIDIQSIELDVYNMGAMTQEIAYPIIGTYVIGDNFGGIYTRAGSRVTNKLAVYIPTYIYK